MQSVLLLVPVSLTHPTFFIILRKNWYLLLLLVVAQIVTSYQGRMNPSVSTVTKLRVISYNLLSSHLSSPSYYTTINPDYLDASNRLKVILNKLDTEIKKGGHDDRPTIIALQEVSYDWAGALHTFFANRGYHLTTGLYGQRFNGYMGKQTVSKEFFCFMMIYKVC
jgi:mRNA deadenylase 3'-5' endonuclease subunit Ccr4